VDVLEPGQTEDDRAEEEAAVDVRPQDHEQRDRPQPAGVGSAIGDEEQDDGEDRHAEELGAQPERHGRDQEGDQRQPGGASGAQTTAQADREQAAEDQRDEGRTEYDETRPPGDPVDRRQNHLGAPLLVRPRQAVDRERPGVDGRDAATVEDLPARPEVVGQVHARKVGDDRGERRQRDGQENPESGQGHRRMLATLGVRMHRDLRTAAWPGTRASLRGPAAPGTAIPLLD
jgi:hypothetical protein